MDFRLLDINTNKEYWLRDLKCTSGTWRDNINHDLWDKVEEDYGWHELSWAPTNGYCGFDLYETKEWDIPILLREWKEEFKRKGWL